MNFLHLNVIPQRKWRRRRSQTAGSLIIELNEIREICEGWSTIVEESHSKLHNIKSTLRQCSSEVKELEAELKRKTEEYQHSVEKLKAEIQNMRVREARPWCDRERLVNYFARVDIRKSRKLIKRVDRELYKQNIIVPQKNDSNKNGPSTSKVPVPLTIQLSDIDSTQFIKKKGSLKLDYTSKCCSCFENEVDCVFYLCGHQCCCSTCAEKLVKNNHRCPICDVPPGRLVKKYLA